MICTDMVAILGIGGLGHLAIQFAAKMGFKTIAIARGKDKEEMARNLGAIHYVDSQSHNAAEELYNKCFIFLYALNQFNSV
jgi:D-arabinose 1-dehydrogenase-like Zn-dependent alcohol dehydrogenase